MTCANCGAAIPDGAAFCPGCGQAVSTAAPPAPPAPKSQPPRGISSKTRGCLTIAGIGFAVLLLIGILAPAPKQTDSNNSETVGGRRSESADGNAAEVATADPEIESSAWSYSQDQDKVRRGTTYYPSTTSTNSIAQDFPYDSHTTMTMTVRKSPAYGTDVILTISSGQMMCPSYDGCRGAVSFDGAPAQRVNFAGPADNSSDTVFVEGAKSFIAKLRAAKKVVIEKTLYQSGNPQFEFDVSDLKWNH